LAATFTGANVAFAGTITAGTWNGDQITSAYLDGGTASPGADKYYGTKVGVIGFHSLPSGMPANGPANAVLGMNAAGDALEWKILQEDPLHQVDITHLPGAIRFGTPQDIGTSDSVQFGKIGVAGLPSSSYAAYIHGAMQISSGIIMNT
jgi:hypothetical protein